MKKGNQKIAVLPLSLAIMALAGCAGTGNDQQLTQSELMEREKQIESREKILSAKEMEVKKAAAMVEQQSQTSSSQNNSMADDTLLPPSAKVGECYARVWVEPTYEQEQIQIKVKDESEKIKLIDAKYQWVEKKVLTKEASSRLETVPAVYGTESETILVREERNTWRTDLSRSAAPASEQILGAAKAGGIDLSASTPGMCYHEHFKPAEYKTVKENVLVKQAAQKIMTEPARYEWAEESVMVSAASQRVENVPAVYEIQTEQVLDKPAHTIWKKGTGPIQRINEATGEIMCLVEVPATYKTITKKVLVSPATTRVIEIPAKYEMVKVKKLVEDSKQVAQEIPEEYMTVTKQELVQGEQFVWHEVHDTSMSRHTRTGAKICLVNEPAKYKTVTRKVVATPASVRKIDIPAKYEAVKVKELVSEAREERTAIPAVYKNVTQKNLVTDGHMQWRSILCETNMTAGRISKIQQALVKEGYKPGPIDGVSLLINDQAKELLGVEAKHLQLFDLLENINLMGDQSWKTLVNELAFFEQSFTVQGEILSSGRTILCRGRVIHAVAPLFLINITDITELKKREREKTEALNFLSHDMRSPMTSVLALIEGAKEENLEPNQTMLLKDIERYIHRNLSYAENFIQLAKLENIQTLNIERCDVHSLIYNAVIQIYPSAKLRDITIHYPETNPELWILCDSSLMERAIVNILDNAVKYSDEDTQIDVDTSVINSVVEIQISDQGSGIPEADLHQLFDCFKQGSNSVGVRSGAGLGLRFVMAVCEKHHGTVTVKNNDHLGSQFTLSIPLDISQ